MKIYGSIFISTLQISLVSYKRDTTSKASINKRTPYTVLTEETVFDFIKSNMKPKFQCYCYVLYDDGEYRETLEMYKLKEKLIEFHNQYKDLL
jgi:hypothetical protein